MEAYPPFLAIIVVFGLFIAAILTLMTRVPVAAAAASCVVLAFVLGWIGWFAFELGLFAALIAILPSLAGAVFGKRLRQRWGK